MKSLRHTLVFFIFSVALIALSFAGIKIRYSYIGPFGYIDSSGKIVIPPRYWSAGDFKNGIAAVIEGRYCYSLPPKCKTFLINKKGEKVAGPFSRLTGFSEGFSAAEFGDDCFSHTCKWGFINMKGETVIKPAYYNSSAFFEGLAAVTVEKRCVDDPPDCEHVYIDKKGRITIPGPFRDAYPFSEHLAAVALDSGNRKRYGFIDRTEKSPSLLDLSMLPHFTKDAPLSPILLMANSDPVSSTNKER